MMTRRRAAARIESKAVTGPCTAEYGPSMLGKKKMARTHSAAKTASAHAIRPGVIRDKADYTGCRNLDERPRTDSFTKVTRVSSCPDPGCTSPLSPFLPDLRNLKIPVPCHARPSTAPPTLFADMLIVQPPT